jgi:hypothetical protein
MTGKAKRPDQVTHLLAALHEIAVTAPARDSAL